MSATAASPEAAAQLLFPPNVQYNNARLYTVKFLSSCFAGAVAGVLGLENTLGFALFIFSTLFTAACLYVKCRGRPAKFVPGGWWELVNPGQENIFSFVLVWTLFYGIVHGTFAAACDPAIRQISMEHPRSQYTIESSRRDGRRIHPSSSGPFFASLPGRHMGTRCYGAFARRVCGQPHTRALRPPAFFPP
ncbi:hypothetical protein PYCCODRAFT_1048738 [Trametes coccinea BRFM310]|uniref:ER membrane protein complex subunit 6 n=1 Tax=Trametes coccinea (strain BRFM310) TaxID=1353009 RepID=A0A1Y2I9Y6_TRAC3|nr:hypothetical protein PYCCODRAFT_1048738 [Trametes coccinea BRFM310]